MSKPKNNKNFLVRSFALLILFCLAIPSGMVFADGFVMVPYSDGWDYVDERSQQATIEYDGGVEKMMIEIELGKNDSKDAVWLFPVPAIPENVEIDVMLQLPKNKGQNLNTLVRKKMSEVVEWHVLSQIGMRIPYGFMYASISSSYRSKSALSTSR